MHPNNPILAGKTCDQRLDRVGIGKIFKDGRGGFLHVAIGMAKNLHDAIVEGQLSKVSEMVLDCGEHKFVVKTLDFRPQRK